MNFVYKAVVILSGALLFWRNLQLIARKKMDIGIGSWWAVTSLIVVVFGIVFNFRPLVSLARPRNLILVYLFVVTVVMTLYLYGLYLSRLKKETEELSRWVSYAKSEADARMRAAAPAEPGKGCGEETR